MVQAGLAALSATDPVDLPDQQVRDEVLALLGCVNQLSAALATRLGSFDARQLSELDALRTTRTWLTAFGRMSQGAASGWLAQARLLRELPALAAAARSGTISAEHLDKVVQLVRHVGIADVRDFDAILAEAGETADPADMQKACERVLAHLDPDGKPPDPEEDLQRREVTFSRLGSMLYLRGRLDPEGGAALMTAVDALMRPPASDDLRTAAQRRADALVELARGEIAGGGLPTVGGVRPHLGILVTPQMLLGAAAATPQCPVEAAGGSGGAHEDPLTRAGVPPAPDHPWLNWIGEIPPELAQRIACDSVVWRIVLDPASGLPLDLGREHRIVPHWLRKALHARDRSCRWPGCDVPAAWTDAHHQVPWYLGGTTDIDQLLSLCRYHHAIVHEGRWTITLDRNTGEVAVTRPDGTPYELRPSLPWTTPSRDGPQATDPPGLT